MLFTKKIAQRIHAKRRAEERYGLTLNRRDQAELVRIIQEGRAELVARQSLRVAIYILFSKGRRVKVVYDRRRANIVSFLPLDEEHLNPDGPQTAAYSK